MSPRDSPFSSLPTGTHRARLDLVGTHREDRRVKSPDAILSDTDWNQLEHAYGAASDTPQRLLQLLDPAETS